jgi:hypothetical protein
MARRRKYNKAKATSKKVFSPKQKTVISKIAKKACTKEAETKFNTRVDSVYLPGAGDFKSWNLFSDFSQGTSDNQVIGNKIHWRGIKIHWLFEPFGGSSRQWFDTPVTVTIWIVETDAYDANGIVLADIRDGISNNPLLFFTNNDTKILYKKTKVFRENKSSDRTTIPGSIWLKRNQSLTFRDLSFNKSLNKKNYYLCVSCNDNHQLVGEQSGTFRYAWKNYYKDS